MNALEASVEPRVTATIATGENVPAVAGSRYVLSAQPKNGGEIFYVDADALPKGGQSFHRILISDSASSKAGETKTLLQVIKEKNTAQGRTADHADRAAHAPPSGHPSHSRQLRYAQASCGDLVARGASPLSFPLHPDGRVLDQSG